MTEANRTYGAESLEEWAPAPTATSEMGVGGTKVQPLKKRIAACDWNVIDSELDENGVGRLGPLLSRDECNELAAAYQQDKLFRSKVVMARHGFGRGEYKYFAYPLPKIITTLRTCIYSEAARTANRWSDMLRSQKRYPLAHAEMLERCHKAGQTRPTPLLLRYEEGDFNCLHQDVYGEHLFPLQLVILLSDTKDFEGGEFVLTEQRPRMQSRVEVVPLQQGEAALFAVNERPRKGAKGYHRTKLRHGVSRLRSGVRFTAGVIFHDAN